MHIRSDASVHPAIRRIALRLSALRAFSPGYSSLTPLGSPLWYYILKEAEQFHQGMRLGPVGTNIVAETFLGIVHGDHESFLWRRANWVPELPSAQPETFTMQDLLNFVGDINPVG